MENQNTNTSTPYYIRDLMLNITPSNIDKIASMWDGISTENKIAILLTINKNDHFPAYFTRNLFQKAIKGENIFIKYLALKNLDIDVENSTIIEKIKEQDSLLKYMHFEDWGRFIFKADEEILKEFFNLPHKAKLAIVRSQINLKLLNQLIEHAFEKELASGNISPLEIFELIYENLKSDNFKNKYMNEVWPHFDGLDWCQSTKDLSDFWNILLKYLAQNPGLEFVFRILPTRIALDEDECISIEVQNALEQIPDEIPLIYLFDRKDVGLEQLRVKMFKSRQGGVYDLKGTLARYNFNINFLEFKELLTQSTQKRQEDLICLVKSESLSYCVHEATIDFFEKYNDNFDELVMDHLEKGKKFLQNRLIVEKNHKHEDLINLKLYRLSKSLVPLNDKDEPSVLSDELEFLKSSIVPGDTWETFIKILEFWNNEVSRKSLEKHLLKKYLIEDTEKEEESQKETIQYTVLNKLERLSWIILCGLLIILVFK